MLSILRLLFVFILTVQLGYAQWYAVNPLTKSDLKSVCYENGEFICITDNEGNLFISEDHGNQWLDIELSKNNSLNAITFTEDQISYIAGNNGKIFVSETKWKDWRNISIQNIYDLNDIKFITNESGVTVGTKEVKVDGKTFLLPSIHLTSNSGKTWDEVEFDFQGKLNSVTYTSDGYIYTVGNDGLLLISSDHGKSWTRESLRVNNNFNCVRICPDNILIIAGDKGAFYFSKDFGERWNKIPVWEFYDLKTACFEASGKISAGGNKNLQAKYGDSGIGVILKLNLKKNVWDEVYLSKSGQYNCVSFCDPEKAIAVGDNGLITFYDTPANSNIEHNSLNDYRLYQNYPNPFNPSTVITYQVPEYCHISLKVFDMLGNEIMTLVNGFKAAGVYQIVFDAFNSKADRSIPGISSGVYFYQLKSDKFNEVKKMVFVE